MNRPYNMVRPRAWRRGRRVAEVIGCAPILTAALCVAAVCALAYWQDVARADVAPLRIFEVSQVAAEDPAAAALIACGPEWRDVVCDVAEVMP